MAYNPSIGFMGPLRRPGAPASTGFNINPGPQGGAGAFGAVPGPVALPPSRYSQVSPAIGANRAEPLISQNLLRDLSGDIDLDSLQNEAARFGITSGMPGSQFSGVRGLNRTEQERRAIRRQGLQDYLAAAQGIGSLVDSPELAAQLATQNAVWASAPNPQAAAEEQMRRWQEQFDKLSMGADGGGAGRPWHETLSAGLAGGVNQGAPYQPIPRDANLPGAASSTALTSPAFGYGPSASDWLASISPAGGYQSYQDPYAWFFGPEYDESAAPVTDLGE